MLNRADKVIATSPNYIKGSTWLKSVEDKYIVVANCINIDRVQLTPEIEAQAAEIRKDNKGKIICVAVGNHTEYKGFKYLIQTSKKLIGCYAETKDGKTLSGMFERTSVLL